MEPEIAAAGTDREGDVACGLCPALANNIPDRKIVAREGHCHSLQLSCIEGDGVEALEDRRGLASGRGVVDVELGDLQEQGASTKDASQV